MTEIIDEEAKTEHEIYISFGLRHPMKPSDCVELIDNLLHENFTLTSWGTHTKDEYIGIIDEVWAKNKSLITTIESQKEEIRRWNNIRPEVQWFAEQMELKLKVNDHKGGWGGMSYRQLKSRLDEEVYEVELAYYAGRDTERLIHETADVANFAMMIADNSRIQEGDK